MTRTATRPGVLRRIALSAAALCAFAPVAVLAHFSHAPAPHAERAETRPPSRQETPHPRAANKPAVEVAALTLPCGGGTNRPCGCHTAFSGRAGSPDVAGPTCAELYSAWPEAPVRLPPSNIEPPSPAPRSVFLSRAPPLSS